MATATDYIKAALRRITSYQSGEQIAAPDMQDCLDTFNDLLDSWSTSEMHVPGVNENIVNWTAGKNQYSVGNPLCTDLGSQPFQAAVTAGSNQITLAAVPTNLLVGATLTSLQNLINTTAINTTINNQNTNFYTYGTTVTAISGNTVTMSQNAIGTSNGNDTITYTVPGDFPFARPMMITAGFTRFNQLDFTLDVFESQEEYARILYKIQPAPWPTVAWYNYTFPYGTLKTYQTPGNSAELHLFTRVILGHLTANSVVTLPQGYARALKWCLAREFWAEYVNAVNAPLHLEKIAKESLEMIKQLNAKPMQRAQYDLALIRGNKGDRGWIFSGGYR